jgi:hypothetical protein
MHTQKLTTEAVRSFFTRTNKLPESVCLELQQIRDGLVHNFPPSDPAESLISSYIILEELERLVRELFEISLLSEAPPGPHGRTPSS